MAMAGEGAGGHAWLGGMCGGGMHGGGSMWMGGHVWQGVCVVGGGACVAGETATAEDGTHPTGMHSCVLVHNKIKRITCYYNFARPILDGVEHGSFVVCTFDARLHCFS